MKNIIISGQKKKGGDDTSNLCQRGGRNESNSNRNMAQPRLVSLLWDGIPLQIKNLEIYISAVNRALHCITALCIHAAQMLLRLRPADPGSNPEQ